MVIDSSATGKFVLDYRLLRSNGKGREQSDEVVCAPSIDLRSLLRLEKRT